MLFEWVIFPRKGLKEIILHIFNFPGEKELVELASINVHIGLDNLYLKYFILLQALKNAFVAANWLIPVHVLLPISNF